MWFVQLNEQQHGCVYYDFHRSLLIVAGAGAGKTTVIAHRAIELLRVLPVEKSIQMLTFSNKAAKEMKERVRRLGCSESERIKYDTYHSWGLKRLKDDPEGFGLAQGFTLLADSDTQKSIRALAKSFGLTAKIVPEDRKRLKPKSWLNTWSLARQAGFDVNNPNNKAALCERLAKAHSLVGDEIHMVWSTLNGYEREKQFANSVDFDDLLYLPLLRLAKDQSYAASINTQIGHVVIDEVQDTNRIQYEMVRRWVQGHCPVTAVGDDDQSIYGWRGAEVSNLKRFVAHFGAEQLRLEENYRSTKSIVNSATGLIRNNIERLEKTPFSSAEQGSVPVIELCSNSREMSDRLIKRISTLIGQGVPAQEIAVLYRTNRMAMILEMGLRRHDIPFHVVGGMSLFDRAEIVAITSALRLAVNPRDTYALKNLTPYIDGIGPGSGYALQEWLEADESRSMMNLKAPIEGLTDKRIEAAKSFMRQLVGQMYSTKPVMEFVQWVVDGPMKLLEREKDMETRSKRSDFIKALADDISLELAERKLSEPDAVWQDVLLDAALRESRQSESDLGQVTLSTVHRSKGLEWDHVLLAGMSEGLMPLENRSDVDDDDAGFSHMEEERRLVFVGWTRARKSCCGLHADRYFFPGTNEDRQYAPSRFVQELNAEVIDLRPSVEADYETSFEEDDFDAEDLMAELNSMIPKGL